MGTWHEELNTRAGQKLAGMQDMQEIPQGPCSRHVLHATLWELNSTEQSLTETKLGGSGVREGQRGSTVRVKG